MISREEAVRFEYPLLAALPGWVLAIVELEQGRREEAEQDLALAEKAALDGKDDVSRSPLWGMVRATRGMMLASEQLWQESEDAFAEALKMLQRCNFRVFFTAMVKSWRAESRMLQNREDEARADLLEAIGIVEGLGDQTLAETLRLRLRNPEN
jgi:hypothetical protein